MIIKNKSILIEKLTGAQLQEILLRGAEAED